MWDRLLGKGLWFLLLWALCWGCAPAGPVPGYAAPKAPARGLFLVASEKMLSPVFARRVILLVKAGRGGAVGLIINSPTPHSLGDVVPRLKGLKVAASPVFAGGPVEPRRLQVLFRSSGSPPRSEPVLDDVFFSRSEQTLLEQGAGASPSALRVFAGYAGWAPGQLERELERGGWHLVSAGSEVLFRERTEGLWRELLPASAAPSRWVRVEGGCLPAC
ncbi:MAG TPA: YqgE/AlgH family protein [Sedimenticola sp.]|nr:YqgE/AlgH family protein [Sedimenticola sp.]